MPRRVLHDGVVVPADAATFGYLGDGFARDARRLWWLGSEVTGIEVAQARVLGGGYLTDGHHVAFRTARIAADAATFAVIGWIERFAIARDRRALYTFGTPIERGPDPATLGLLGAGFAADASGVWYVADQPAVRVDVDPQTLRILDGDHAADPTRVWHRGTLVAGADPATAVALGFGYLADAQRVYLRGHALAGVPRAGFRARGYTFGVGATVFHEAATVAAADPETFTVLANTEASGWARDGHRVWYRAYRSDDYSDHEALDEVAVDPATFVALDHELARDATRVLHGTQVLADADAATFRVLGHGWARDAGGLWFGARPMRGTDPDTLAIWEGYAVVDRAEPALAILGDGYASEGARVLFAGYTVDGPRPPARSLGGGYLVDPDAAWFFLLATESRKVPAYVAAGGRLDGADPATLRRDRGFAIDRAHVYAGAVRIAADPMRFRALDGHHGTDGQHVYFDGQRLACDPIRLRVLGGRFAVRGFTLATAHAIDDAWATDGTTLFVAGHPVWDRTARYLSEASFAALRELHVADFVVLDPWWGTDGQVVVELTDGCVVDALHAPSFEALGGGYARDASIVWSSRGRLHGVDAQGFRVLGGGYASDGARAWYAGHAIAHHAPPLDVLGGSWARDATGILCHGRRVAADRDSFVVVGAQTAAEAAWDPRVLAISDPAWLGEHAALGRDATRLWWGSTPSPAGAVAIGDGYALANDIVVHAGQPFDAEAATFEALGGGYARDAYRVYFHDRATR